MKLRSPEEITAQLEARFAEIKAEGDKRAVDPMLNYPCETCKWRTKNYEWASNAMRWKYAKCSEPLVNGFGRSPELNNGIPPLCGPEKALWQPKPTVLQRFLAWFWDREGMK